MGSEDGGKRPSRFQHLVFLFYIDPDRGRAEEISVLNVEDYSARAWYLLSGAEQALNFAVIVAVIVHGVEALPTLVIVLAVILGLVTG